MSTTATSSDQRVERSERSFVHSERMTRHLRDAQPDAQAGEAGAGDRRSCGARLGLARLAWRRLAVELDVVAGDVHERLLERGAHRRQLVQDDPVRGGRLADLLGGQARHLERAVVRRARR